ncbi:hypothetical protein LTS01_025554 [Friedmanniomyces endolithicus]|nr:hypothetical protein LTS01_025554 [Friedmanniomyces endolithicus]
MQSLLDTSVLDKSLLSITIHTTYEYSNAQVHREGKRLCIVKNVPDINQYLSTELNQTRRSLAVCLHIQGSETTFDTTSYNSEGGTLSGSSEGAEDGEEGVEVKKEKNREKDRIAAAKCRARKKGSVDGLEEDYRRLNAIHSFLTHELRELRDEFSTLRTVALQHTSATSGCGSAGLHEYNSRKASQVAYGLGGPLVASPSSDVLFRSQTNLLSGGPMAEMFGRHQASSSSIHDSFATVTAQEAAAMTAASSDSRKSFSPYIQGPAERDEFQS